MALDLSKYGVTPLSVDDDFWAEQKPKNTLTKVGEFLAPQTTKTLQQLSAGEKPSGRQLVGSAFEVGSFFIPAGAIGRSLGIGAKAVKTAKAIETGKKLTTGGRIVSGAKTLLQSGKLGAATGASEGLLYGAGQAIAEGKNVEETISEAGSTAVGFGVGGALLSPILSISGRGLKGISNMTSRGIRATVGAQSKLLPATKEQAIKNLTEAYSDSFVKDKTAISKALDVEAVKARRLEKDPVKKKLITPNTLLQELAVEGYVPMIEGKLANMRPVLDDLADRRGAIVDFVDQLLDPVKTLVPTESFRQKVLDNLDFGIDERATNQVISILDSTQRRFGNSLTAKNINWIRKQMNAKTKSFMKEEFIQDAYNAVGNGAREVLDEIAPLTRSANGEIARLSRIESVARQFHQKAIDAGILSSTVGRYLATIGGASAGLSVAGPGGLVVAGLLAHLGSQASAQLVRKIRFNPKLVDLIRQGVSRDKKLKTMLLKKATSEEKEVLKSIFAAKHSIFK